MNKRLFTLLLALFALGIGMTYGQACTANFTYTSSGTTVAFVDASTTNDTITGWSWTFGDGSSGTGNPITHTYNINGPVTVCLTITTNTGCTDTYCGTVNFGGGQISCQAQYTSTISGNTATFADQSTASPGSVSSWAWDFGDGANSTLQNPTHTYGQVGSYVVCLVISTTDGCNSTYCDSVVVGGQTGPFTINGRIYPANLPNTSFSQAEVFLIVYDTAQLTLTAIDTVVVNQSGVYQFTNVPAGDYRVKAALLPGSPSYTGYMPTYYTASLFWSSATVLPVYSNQSAVDIGLLQGNNPGGPGFVGGLVTQGANKTAGPGDPLEHIQIMVLDMNDDPIQYMYTDANGEFNFSNLAYGTYQIYAEVLGKATVPEIVTLDAQNPGVQGMHIEVHSDQVITWIAPVTALGFSMEVFPNPASTMAQIVIETDLVRDMRLQLVGMEGRVLQERALTVLEGKNVIDLEVNNLAAGVYFLKVRSEDEFLLRKILKN